MKKIMTALIIILLIGSNIYMVGKIYFAGNQTEREQLLSFTVWKLNSEGYKEDEIQNIKVDYNPMKGGNFPYTVYVTFNDHNIKTQSYRWSDNNKTSVKKIETF